MKPRLLYLALLLFISFPGFSQIMPLYADSIPNSTGYITKEIIKGPANDPDSYQKTAVPTITAYLPTKEKATGTAVIIFPGGGYTFLAFKKEGTNVGKAFAEKGITAFVVKYRLPSDSTMKDKSIGPLQDAQRAIQLVRKRSAEWGINPQKIGIIGFSAGGHLASSLGTHFQKSYIPNPDNISLRPDFMILVYPVISMESGLAHMGSRTNLLGNHPSDDLIKRFSNDQQVSAETPPTYLTQTQDDKVVPVDNSLVFYAALRKSNIPSELHLYATGNHGFLFKLPVAEWLDPMLLWMKKNNWGIK